MPKPSKSLTEISDKVPKTIQPFVLFLFSAFFAGVHRGHATAGGGAFYSIAAEALVLYAVCGIGALRRARRWRRAGDVVVLFITYRATLDTGTAIPFMHSRAAYDTRTALEYMHRWFTGDYSSEQLHL